MAVEVTQDKDRGGTVPERPRLKDTLQLGVMWNPGMVVATQR